MHLDSTGNVIATILRRSDGDSMYVSSLHPFAVRLFFEHLLPAHDLTTQDLPAELANTSTLVKYLRDWDSSLIVVDGEDGEFVARLVTPSAKGPETPQPAGDAAAQSFPDSASSASPDNGSGEGPQHAACEEATPLSAEAEQSVMAEQQEVHCVRQLMCSTLLDWILTRKGATHYSSATDLEDARLRCIELLVRPWSTLCHPTVCVQRTLACTSSMRVPSCPKLSSPVAVYSPHCWLPGSHIANHPKLCPLGIA